MSTPKIAQLLDECGRYDANILPDLQEHLDRQLKTSTYDLDANLALLKLYLLYPEEAKVDVIERVLLKALMAFPATDFHLCMYQIPEKYHTQLKEVIQLAQWLEMAKFTKFWKDAEAVEALGQATGWQDAVRSFIGGVISSTYRSIKGSQLIELMNVEASGVDAIIKAQGWSRSKEDKDLVIVNTASFESVAVEPQASTNISLEQYQTLFMAASGV